MYSSVAFAQTAETSLQEPTDSTTSLASTTEVEPRTNSATSPTNTTTTEPVTTTENSKDSEHATVGIFFEPLLALFGFYEGDIGVAITDKVVIGVWGQYFDYEFVSVKLSGYGVGLGTQLFPLQKSFKGFYVYPMIKYQRVDFGVSGAGAAGLKYYGPQATLGYQWNWEPFSLRLGGGVEYTFGEVSANVDAKKASTDYRGLGYELDIAIGFAF
jgi:hypothetical protein